MICNRLKVRQPDVLDAFFKLREHQSAPYNEYRNWASKELGRAEIIRSALIQCRKNSIEDVNHFHYIIDETCRRIGRSLNANTN